MPNEHLQQQLSHLRDTLSDDAPLDSEQRQFLAELCQELESTLEQHEKLSSESNLPDTINLAVERFEVEHPTLAAALRNIVQSLSNMGI